MNRCIFLNYRRDDTAGYAGRLAVDLRARLEGDRRIVMDVDTFGPGDLFAESIDQSLRACDAFITLIGRRWLEADSDGRRRIDDDQDWVRIELAVALSRRIRVIPVLVDGAVLPDKADLPPELSGLRDHQALILDNSTWQVGIDRLVSSLAATGAATYPALALSASRVDFGTIGLNEQSPRHSVRLINTGMGQLNASASSDFPWLIVSTRADALDLMVDTSQPGEHAGKVLVRSAGGTATIEVSATVSTGRRARGRPPPTRPARRPAERVHTAARWLTTSLLVGAVLAQVAWSSAVHDAIHASRSNLPADGPWTTLVWLLPVPAVVAGACLVAMGRYSGIAVGCIASAVLWIVTSLVLVRAAPQSFGTGSHDVILVLLLAALCALVVAAPEIRERVRPNRSHPMVLALILLAAAVVLRTESVQIAQALTAPEDDPVDWIRPLHAPTIWPSIVIPVLICVPAAVVVCNRAQMHALVVMAGVQVLFPVVVRSMTLGGAVDRAQAASTVVVAALVYVAGSVCILLAVLLGQQRPTHPPPASRHGT
jgi:hypothetical protein